MAMATTTVPIWRAALSLVPKRAIARSLREAANESMNRFPTASVAEVPVASSRLTTSMVASAAAAPSRAGNELVHRLGAGSTVATTRSGYGVRWRARPAR